MSSSSSFVILCVDDDPDNCAIISEAIKEAAPAAQLQSAHNGIEALQYLQQSKSTATLPSLILLDINMPLMDGKQTIVAIKKDEVLKDVPLFLFTASASYIDRMFCERYGVETVTKPANGAELKALVKKVLAYCRLA